MSWEDLGLGNSRSPEVVETSPVYGDVETFLPWNVASAWLSDAARVELNCTLEYCGVRIGGVSKPCKRTTYI